MDDVEKESSVLSLEIFIVRFKGFEGDKTRGGDPPLSWGGEEVPEALLSHATVFKKTTMLPVKTLLPIIVL